MFEANAVECLSVEDFLERYYKPQRYHGRGAEYAAELLKDYKRKFEKNGFVFISHHDSVTGRVVSYFRKAEGCFKNIHTLSD